MRNPEYFKEQYFENKTPFHWELKDIDQSLPEYLFRESTAQKLSNSPVENILKEYVYHSKKEMLQLVIF